MAAIINISDEAEKDVNKIEEFGKTALHLAVINKNLENINTLLFLGANVNARDDHLTTPLHVAANENRPYLKINSFFLKNCNEDGGKMNDSHYCIMKVLLEKGAEVNVQDKDGNTPLHLLVRCANVKTIRLFLNFKANVNIINNRGEIPLFHAARTNKLEVVQLLVERGSNVNSIDECSSTILHHACMSNYEKSNKKIKYFVKSGVNIEAHDCENQTPFMQLLYCFPWETSLKFFLKYANVNTTDDYGKNVITISRIKKILSNILLEHLAKLEILGITISSSLYNSIANDAEYRKYFEKCTKELSAAKNDKIKNQWVSFFNLLVDSKRKLKNYAGNINLIQNFKDSDCLNKFPIYGSSMKKNINKAIQGRIMFDESTVLLSNNFPIFNPTHLIIRDVLDCLSYKDYAVFTSEV